MLGRDRPGRPGVGQPIHRKPAVRIGRVLNAPLIEGQRPTHPRPSQIDRHMIAVAGGGELAAHEHGLSDVQHLSGQGRAGVVAQPRLIAFEGAVNAGAGQADRAVRAGAGGGELAAEEHGLADLQAVGVQSRAGVVAQPRPVAVERAVDAGAGQADRTVLGVADDDCFVQSEHTAGEPVGGQGCLGGVFEPTPDKANIGQAGISGDDALLKEAIAQLKSDISGEVFQVSRPEIQAPRRRSPCGSGSAASRPSRISRITVARITVAPQVRDPPHDRIDALSITSPLAARSSHSPRRT